MSAQYEGRDMSEFKFTDIFSMTMDHLESVQFEYDKRSEEIIVEYRKYMNMALTHSNCESMIKTLKTEVRQLDDTVMIEFCADLCLQLSDCDVKTSESFIKNEASALFQLFTTQQAVVGEYQKNKTELINRWDSDFQIGSYLNLTERFRRLRDINDGRLLEIGAYVSMGGSNLHVLDNFIQDYIVDTSKLTEYLNTIRQHNEKLRWFCADIELNHVDAKIIELLKRSEAIKKNIKSISTKSAEVLKKAAKCCS